MFLLEPEHQRRAETTLFFFHCFRFYNGKKVLLKPVCTKCYVQNDLHQQFSTCGSQRTLSQGSQDHCKNTDMCITIHNSSKTTAMTTAMKVTTLGRLGKTCSTSTTSICKNMLYPVLSQFTSKTTEAQELALGTKMVCVCLCVCARAPASACLGLSVPASAGGVSHSTPAHLGHLLPWFWASVVLAG